MKFDIQMILSHLHSEFVPFQLSFKTPLLDTPTYVTKKDCHMSQHVVITIMLNVHVESCLRGMREECHAPTMLTSYQHVLLLLLYSLELKYIITHTLRS